MKLWIVGEYTATAENKAVAWAFCGVFDSEERAKAECVTPRHFYGPAPLNVRIPDKEMEWPGVVYPLADAAE